jgi:hypothetical protein
LGLITTTVTPASSSRIHDRAVGTFDRDLARAGALQDYQQLAHTGGVVLDRGAADLTPVRVDDRDSVIVTCPIDSACDTVRRCRWQNISGRLQNSLLAARPSGQAPYLWRRGTTASSLTVRRSTALSPVDGRRAPGTAEPRNT